MGLFDLLKPKNEILKGDISSNAEVIFQKEFLIVGEEYECRKNPKKKRAEVIKKTSLSTPVHIEKFIYDRKPAYMIVNTKQKLDLGVLSQGAASWLSDYYSKGNVSVFLVDKYQKSFRVKIVIYK